MRTIKLIKGSFFRIHGVFLNLAKRKTEITEEQYEFLKKKGYFRKGTLKDITPKEQKIKEQSETINNENDMSNEEIVTENPEKEETKKVEETTEKSEEDINEEKIEKTVPTFSEEELDSKDKRVSALKELIDFGIEDDETLSEIIGVSENTIRNYKSEL